MKKLLPFIVCILVNAILISCKKELSCENCSDNNKPPVAIAGPDQITNLPTDSISLNGSSSYDPDGTIVSYKWTKISGPVSSNILKTDSSKTLVKALLMGVYKFELTVKDNGGLSAKDTMMVVVNDPAVNQPPIACAGADKIITLPVNTVNLDAGCSSDPDNNIRSYIWTKISGPATFNIVNAGNVQTPVNNLVQGTYQFEIKVTDAAGLFSKDTMEVTVYDAIPACNNRPILNATLVPIGTLSIAGHGLVSTSLGNKIFFAGGIREQVGYSTRVDIYDITTGSWSTSELSQAARQGMVTATAGNKIFFAGGGDNDIGWVTSRVDIFDISTNTWSVAELSKGREYLSAATVGNKVFFAGGGSWEPFFVGSDVVDIYDNSTNIWTTARLSIGRSYLTATTAGNKIYFAGGSAGNGFQNVTTRIDIFDNTTNTWSTSELLETKSWHAAISTSDKIFWASGITQVSPGTLSNSNSIEIKDINTGLSTITCIEPRAMLNAVAAGDYIVFFTGYGTNTSIEGTRFEIFNKLTGTWYNANLNKKVIASTIIAVNNIIYVAGGTDDYGLSVFFNHVWKLEF